MKMVCNKTNACTEDILFCGHKQAHDKDIWCSAVCENAKCVPVEGG